MSRRNEEGYFWWKENRFLLNWVDGNKLIIAKINGKNISDIFESNGLTVKNATNATNATNAANVTSQINGVAPNQIFEADGKTVKKAKEANIAYWA